MTELRLGSLFSGIGGLDLGLERAGMRVVWQSEIEPYPCEVLAKHWPGVPNLGDITAINWDEVEPVDVLCGGFPCQDVSLAGKRAGIKDGTRSGLWRYFYEAICILRPRYAIIENVPGLLSSNDGRDFATILGQLAQAGYDAEWQSISAASLGAPQKRERIFIVAYTTGQRRETLSAKSIFIDKESYGNTWEPLEFRRTRSGDVRCIPNSGTYRECDGNPSRLDRYIALGNAVVPQVAEYVGRCILEHANG